MFCEKFVTLCLRKIVNDAFVTFVWQNDSLRVFESHIDAWRLAYGDKTIY